MSNTCYTVGRARRFVAGNIWCAQVKNTGKLPCLKCKGKGTIDRGKCPQCKLTGYEEPEVWYLWFRLHVQFLLRGWYD